MALTLVRPVMRSAATHAARGVVCGLLLHATPWRGRSCGLLLHVAWSWMRPIVTRATRGVVMRPISTRSVVWCGPTTHVAPSVVCGLLWRGVAYRSKVNYFVHHYSRPAWPRESLSLSLSAVAAPAAVPPMHRCVIFSRFATQCYFNRPAVTDQCLFLSLQRLRTYGRPL